MTTPLLSVRGLATHFRTDEGTIRAVDGITFDVAKGTTLGIVGESGSGKSVTSLSIMRLIPNPPGQIVAGQIDFAGRNLLSLSEEEMRGVRGKRIAMIFQDPMTSLNPFMRISDQLKEMTMLHLGYDSRRAFEHAVEMMTLVGIPDPGERIRSYPHEFSGGMRQRAMIAMALSCRPELLIADEPSTALDVTTQAQILELIEKLQNEMGMSVMLITHDLGVVAGLTDEIIVMYAGRIFERARTAELFARPGNPYTKALLRSIPSPTARGARLFQIPGLPPDLARLGPGCPFAPRCDYVQDVCRKDDPPFVKLHDTHYSLCHFATAVHAESPVNA